MSSVEIEDVLSSIRRLVSEDLRPTPARPVEAEKPAEAGKLMLTPALRVVPGSAAMAEAPAAETLPDELPTAETPIETVVARLGAGVTDDWEPEAEAESWDIPVWEPEVIEVDLEAVEEAEVLAFTGPDAARLEEAWRDGAWPDGPVEAEEEEAPFIALTGDEGEAGDLAEAAAMAEIARAEDSIAATATAAMPGLFAPEDGDDFDEEALREVVRDIIREELQGALGERITRNVRKLVRAEIYRALAARELS